MNADRAEGAEGTRRDDEREVGRLAQRKERETDIAHLESSPFFLLSIGQSLHDLSTRGSEEEEEVEGNKQMH
eukprot:71204-Hanusia_phi.AAC.1